jgi:transposase-like protein
VSFGGGIAEMQETIDNLTDQNVELQNERDQLKALVFELKAELNARCAHCPTPVAQTQSGQLQRWIDGGWVEV